MPTVNGHSLLTLELREPRIGVWVADIEVDAEEKLGDGPFEIDVDGVKWTGGLLRGAVEATRYHALVAGGSAKLGTELGAKHYTDSTVRMIVGEVLKVTGDTLSDTIDPALLDRKLARWSRAQGSGGAALKELADELRVSFRVLRDGTLWFGEESWPDAPDETYEPLDASPSKGRIMIAPETAFLQPGMVFRGAKLGFVLTRVGSDFLRQIVHLEEPSADASTTAAIADTSGAPAAASDDSAPRSPAEGFDPAVRPIARVVEAVMGRRVDLAQWYPSQVVAQSSDLQTLSLLPDDARIRGQGIEKVPLRHGLPGCTVKVKPGSRVCLFFENNDALKPAAGLWPTGDGVLEISIASDTKLTLSAPTVRVEGDLQVTGEVTAKSDSLATAVALTHHKHPTGMGPSEMPIAPNV